MGIVKSVKAEPLIRISPSISEYEGETIAHNTIKYLNIPTYEGSGEAMHPDVLFIPEGWNGYRYWMTFTPYPGGDSNYENPSIAASENGIDWEVPDGLSNPIDVPGSYIYNSDTELCCENGIMHCFFRTKNLSGEETVYSLQSTDGISWNNKIELFSVTLNGSNILSPAIVKFNNYKIYTVNMEGTKIRTYKLQYRESDTLISGYGSPIDCVMDYIPENKVIWHINITPWGNKLIGIFTFCDSGTSGNNSILYYAESIDGINWNVSKRPLLLPTVSGWDNWMIYRSCLIKGHDTWRLYYSAVDLDGHWHTGMTTDFGIKIKNIKVEEL